MKKKDVIRVTNAVCEISEGHILITIPAPVKKMQKRREHIPVTVRLIPETQCI